MSLPLVGRAREGYATGVLGVQRPDNGIEILPPDRLRRRWKDVVPDRGETAFQLRQASGTSQKPPVEMLAAVAPTADMDPADVAYRADGTLDSGNQPSQLGRNIIGQIARFSVMGSWLEDQNERQTRRLARGFQPPPFLSPQELRIRSHARSTVNPAGTAALHLIGSRRQQWSGTHVAVKRKGLPFLDRRHTQRLSRPRV